MSLQQDLPLVAGYTKQIVTFDDGTKVEIYGTGRRGDMVKLRKLDTAPAWGSWSGDDTSPVVFVNGHAVPYRPVTP